MKKFYEVLFIDTLINKTMNVLELLKGWKTYIVGACMVVVGLYQGNMELVLEGLGLITLRAGVAKLNG